MPALKGHAIAACVAALAAFGAAGAGADEAVRYRLEVDYGWSAATHPLDFPAEAHVSDLLVVTHDDRYALFSDGLTASGGIELLAENGRDTILRAEWAEAARKNRAGEPFAAAGVASPGQVTVEFVARPEHPFLSFVAMLAPSPDWFAGVAALPLKRDGVWIDRAEVTLWAWDAGTDGGMTYEAENADTQPRAVVRLLATPHFLDDAGLRPVGRAVLRRVGGAGP